MVARADPDVDVLVLTRSEREAEITRSQFDRGLDTWRVQVHALAEDSDSAALAAEAAISQTTPVMILFVGWAVAAGASRAGDVLVADRVAMLQPAEAPRIRPRRRTRRADLDLARHARRICRTDGWRRRSSAGIDTGGELRVGLAATGSGALAIWTDEGPAAGQAAFDEALAVDPAGWDFLFGYYDDVDLPAITVWGLAGEAGCTDAQTQEACQRAAAVAADLLDAIPPDGLHADPLGATADEGEAEHLRRDAELLPHESTQGIVQRPFLDSVRAGQARAGSTPRPAKKSVRTKVLGALIAGGGMPADLWLRIRLNDGTLTFELHSDANLPYHGMAVGETTLSGEFGGTPRDYRENLKNRIREIAADPDASDVQQLENLGDRLYNDLFPEKLKQEYARIREMDAKTLLITSEEPWIPWELVRPHGPDFPNDDFLCVQFAMTRWLADFNPKKHFQIASMASLEAGAVTGQERLPSAKAEIDFVQALAARCHVENLSPDSAEYEAVKTLLNHSDREISLWHVAAHGRLGTQDPDESVLILEGGNWRAADLAGRLGYGIQRARPLVFFNACLVGQQDLMMGRLAGWPSMWVVQNHCGGFVAPQWSISSELAAVFSKAFYAAVVGDEEGGVAPQTLGEAVRTARLEVRRQAPVDPAWLSYAVYGHPNARVSFGVRETTAVV